MDSQTERDSPPHLMIDIETLALTPDAAILSVAAVWFDPRGDGYGEDFFYDVVTLQSNADSSRVIDPATVTWWMQQSDDARSVFSAHGQPLRSVLSELRVFVEQRNCALQTRVWAMGPSFDLTVLEDAYRDCGISRPWRYDAHRDVRTVFDLSDLDRASVPQVGTGHNALDDARWQVLAVQAGYRRLGLASPTLRELDERLAAILV